MCRDNVPRARFASTVEPQPGSKITRSPNGKVFRVREILMSKLPIIIEILKIFASPCYDNNSKGMAPYYKSNFEKKQS